MTRNLTARTAFVAALFFSLFSLSAYAQGTSDQRSACMGDAFRFCAAYIPNVSAIEGCLKQNRANLTPACRAEFGPDDRTKIQSHHFR